MADPLSIITTATSAALQLYSLASQIRDAPSEITQVKTELRDLQSILAAARDVCQRTSVADALILRTLEQCAAHCEENLAPLDTALKPFAGGGGERFVARVQWVWKKGEVVRLMGNLGRTKETLGVAVSVINA
jgi:hypothetical protein